MSTYQTKELNDSAKISKLMSELYEWFIQADDLYEYLLNLSFYPDFTGKLTAEDSDDNSNTILFEFNSLEDAVAKMKNFVQSY
jgi:hypothetical protein